ncbi:MAG: 3-oxoacyl-ACP reductase FabG [Candidatus Omnitrophica bacterium]|nr:3-oxoacyl-ACP reductase FabG [Candidatus Omnitrophota bacterium]
MTQTAHRLNDKVALVTGGAKGIGAAVVRRLADEGAKVYFTFHTSGAGEAAPKGRVFGFPCDVRKKNDVEAFVGRVLERESRVDVLVNNAGIIRDGLFLALSEEDWEDVWATNLMGTVYFTRAVLRPMILQRGGRIINLSSIVGELGGVGQANYAASKGAVNALTKSLAAEVASKNILVNAVSPGMVNTAMSGAARAAFGEKIKERIPVGSFAEPEEIAEVVAFLASEEARYITGQIITVDGGISLLSRR